MKYKVGDRVKIKSLDWYNENKNQLGRINCGSKIYTIEMCSFCGNILTIQSICLDFYLMEEDILGYEFTDEMIEGLVEKNVNIDVAVEETTKDISDKVTDIIVGQLMYGNSFNLPKGYILKDENGNVINATKIVLEKKKKEYPKTYEECCKVMNYCYNPVATKTIHKEELIRKFQFLLMYRDAYWKIAGEEMRLGKPWEPDYDSGVNKYGIICINGVIQKSNPTTNWERHLNKVLDFPTAEMRDAFYENFRGLIEQCKELL